MPRRAKPKVKTRLEKIEDFLRSYNFLGLVNGLVFFCLSLFPSLLPRSWFLQGLVSGAALAIGYGLGVLLSFLIRWLFDKDVLVKFKSPAWKAFYILGPVVAIIFLVLGEIWQNQLRELVEVEKPGGMFIIGVFLTAGIFGYLFVKLGRSVRRLYRRILDKIDRVMPRRISVALSFLFVTLFVWWVVSGLFLSFLGAASGVLYDKKNKSTPEGVTQTTESTRSGSNESFVPWDTLGYQGQKFIGKGPNQDQLKEFAGSEPKQPVRVYVGVNSAEDAQQRADLAVKELKRTDAFKRKVLVVAVPTGTGWLNPQTVDTLEYMYGGDSAIVAQQYSYLPSWISFLVDKQKAQDTGRALFDTVYAEWSELPENERPKLIIYGLSLGSFGGQSAFSSPSAMLHSVDGALWQGTPGDTELWKEVSRRRDTGSPEWQPVVDNGNEITFASQNSDILSNESRWGKSKVLYLQHGSDPIVWFNFNLPLHKPDWFSEKRAPDVMDNTLWIPFVTFFQLAADQVVGMNVPRSYGHNYETTTANAWAAIAAPEGWSQEKADKLQAIINSY